jgi:hypothetical protein
MDGSRKGSRKGCEPRESCVRRKFEWNRLEQAVWAMAYEEVWPIIRRAVHNRRTKRSAVDGSAEQTACVAAGA